MTPADPRALRETLARGGDESVWAAFALAETLPPLSLAADPVDAVLSLMAAARASRTDDSGNAFVFQHAVRTINTCLAHTRTELATLRATNRDLHRRAQKAESFRERHGQGILHLIRAKLNARRARTIAEAERDAARELAGLTWTAPDVDAWGKFADEKGATGIRDRLNRMFRRAVTAEEQVRQLLNDAGRQGKYALSAAEAENIRLKETVEASMSWQAIETAPSEPDCYHDLPGASDCGLGYATNSDTGEIEYLLWWECTGHSSSIVTHWRPNPVSPTGSSPPKR